MERLEPSPLCVSIKQSGEGSPHSIRSAISVTAIAASASLPPVQEDRPFLDVGHLHYVLRRPGVLPVHLPDLICAVGLDYDQGAGPILERPAEDDHSCFEQRIHIARVFVPEGLFTRCLVRVPERAGSKKRGIVCRVGRHFAPLSETTSLRKGIRRELSYCQPAVNVYPKTTRNRRSAARDRPRGFAMWAPLAYARGTVSVQ